MDSISARLGVASMTRLFGQPLSLFVVLSVLFLGPEIRAESHIGDFYQLLDNFEAATDSNLFDLSLSYLMEAREIYDDSISLPDTAKSDLNLAFGRYYSELAEYDSCTVYFDKALDYLKVFPNSHPRVAYVQLMRALLFNKLAQYSLADSLAESSLKIFKENFGELHEYVAKALDIKAETYLAIGRYDEAIQLLGRSMEIWEELLGPDDPDLGTNLSEQAVYYWTLKDYSKAEVVLLRSIDILEKHFGPNSLRLTSAVSSLSVIYKSTGRFDEAESLQKRAIQIRESNLGRDHPDVANAKNNLGALYFAQHRFGEATVLFLEAKRVFERVWGNDHSKVALVRMNLADCYFSLGDFQQAVDLYRMVLRSWENSFGPDHLNVTICLRSMAEAYAELGEYDNAIEYYRRFIKHRGTFLEYVFSFSSEEQKLRWVKSFPLIKNSLITLALRLEGDELGSLALESLLKGKSVVVDAVMKERQYSFCSGDRDSRQKMGQLSVTYQVMANMSLARRSSLEPRQFRDSLASLRRISDSLETVLSRSCSLFEQELAIKRFSLNDIYRAVPEGEVIWEFVRFKPFQFGKVGDERTREREHHYAAIVFDKSGILRLADLGPASKIDSLITEARRRVDAIRSILEPQIIEYEEKRLRETLRPLYDLIVSPLVDGQLIGRRVIISPDGLLNLLPFEMLPVGEDRYLIEEMEICYLSSGRDLLRRKSSPPSDMKAVVLASPDFDNSLGDFSDDVNESAAHSLGVSDSDESESNKGGCLEMTFLPIRHSEEEGKLVAETIRSQKNFHVLEFYRENASEQSIREMSDPPTILHLSTHGFFCSLDSAQKASYKSNPLLFSGLALAGANGSLRNGSSDNSDDGLLTALEISGLNLSGTDLVTLSACETGMGELVSGEGVFGLRRAFHHAGAGSVLMSLWAIPDKETAELMVSFYRNWLGGRPRQAALRESALAALTSTRQRAGHSHPYFWAGFVLAGNQD